MARFLLVIYLLTSLVGNGSFVMCEEPDSSLNFESLLQPCCGEEERESAPATDECDCRDSSGSILLTHLPRLGELARHVPALLPQGLPQSSASASSVVRTALCADGGASRARPDLPGEGSCPRVLRA